MKIAVLGATRGIGRQLVLQGVERGHQMTVLARDPSRLDRSGHGLTVVKGDARDREAVKKLVVDQDAICSCLGIGLTWKRVHLFSASTSLVLSHVSHASTPRVLVITGVGAGDSRGHGGFLYDKFAFPLLMRPMYDDKDRQEELLRDSESNWTIIRPGFLTNGPRTGRYRVYEDLTGVTLGRISRADVAAFMVSELEQPQFERRTVNLSY